ncbi:MAG: hypothetical protein R2856_15660 [Caldilineaceae bacterium]
MRGFVDEAAYCAAKHGLEDDQSSGNGANSVNIAASTIKDRASASSPTNITRRVRRPAAEERAARSDPAESSAPAVWLAAQPPSRFTGLRFDAGPLADTIVAEGYEFEFAPEKVTRVCGGFMSDEEERGNA